MLTWQHQEQTYIAQKVQDLFDRMNWEVLRDPPYSSDLSCEIFMYLVIKRINKSIAISVWLENDSTNSRKKITSRESVD